MAVAGDLTSDDEFSEDIFSDGDDERPNTANGEGPGGSFFLESMIRPLAQGTRSRMCRMTSGRSRAGVFPLHPPQAQQLQQHHQHQATSSSLSGGSGSATSPQHSQQQQQGTHKTAGGFLQLSHQP